MTLTGRKNLVRRGGQILTLTGLLGLAVLGCTVVVRGSWAETVQRNPPSVAEGPLCQVYKDAAGTQVRCAIRLPYRLDAVWDALTDYDHFGDICPYLHGTRIEPSPDGSCRLSSRVDSFPTGQIPFTVEMQSEQDLFQYVSRWDQPGGSLLVNRGAWELYPMGDEETLLVISMEIEVRGVPTFVLRNLSLQRLPMVARSVAARLQNGPTGKVW